MALLKRNEWTWKHKVIYHLAFILDILVILASLGYLSFNPYLFERVVDKFLLED